MDPRPNQPYSSTSMAATRPGGSLPTGRRQKKKQQQQMSVVVPLNNSELMSLSAATLSSFPLGVPETTETTETGISSSRSAGFDTALYDPTSDSVHILPHSRRRRRRPPPPQVPTKDSQAPPLPPPPPPPPKEQQLDDSGIIVGNAKSNRSRFVYSPSPRRQSFDLPLRNHHQPPGLPESNSRPSIAPFHLGHIRNKTVDLMSPPPGRKRSQKALIEHVSSKSVDANPSEALTKQIASSVLHERYGNRRTDDEMALLPERRLSGSRKDSAQDDDHYHQQQQQQQPPPPRWGLPSNPRSWINHSRSSSKTTTTTTATTTTAPTMTTSSSSSASSSRASSRSSGPRFRSGIPSIPESSGGRTVEDEDDPFQYDRQDTMEERRSRSRGPAERKTDAGGGGGRDVTTSTAQGYPCPFRRRNPVVFNVRDHESCARRSFPDIAELRRHLRAEHHSQTATYRCPRCQQAFPSQNELSRHLTVPLEDMCEPRLMEPDGFAEAGITDEMDRALSGSRIHTWPEIWHLLFPQDLSVLDPEILPVVEIFEAEEEFDDSAAELKDDLCECLRRVLPDQAGDALVFNVLAGQIQLVFEQHRAKVSRRCRNGAAAQGNRRPAQDRSRFRLSRFSVGGGGNPAAAAAAASQRSSYRHSHHPSVIRPRGSQHRPALSRRTTSISPSSSSVYSRSSSFSSSSSSYQQQQQQQHLRARSVTRSSSLSVESPRLPFRDWVQGVKLNPNPASPPPLPPPAPPFSSPPPSGAQRDSGLALQCDDCGAEPCQCPTYAEKLSAFLTPVPGAVAPVALSPYGHGAGDEEEGEDMDWAAQYVDEVLSAGGLLTARGPVDAKEVLGGQEKMDRRSPMVPMAQPAFI